MDELQRVALGRAPADLAVRGGRVLLPGVDEPEERDVLVAGDRIAATVEPGEAGDASTTLDATGRVVVPGFLDAHTHLDVVVPAESCYHRSLAGGTTTVVTEVEDLGGVFGAEAVQAVLEATADLPLTVFATVPPGPLADTFEPAWADDREADRLRSLLARDRVVGVGEVDWIHLVGRDSPIESLVEAARAEGVPVAAHAAGCSGAELSALAGLVDNDHEAITAEGVLDRVSRGIHAIGRSGSIRDDSGAVARAHGEVDPAELSLSSDGVSPRDLLDDGHMDAAIRRTIAAGVPAVDAVRMATVVSARHFGLPHGVIAPGRPADLVLLSDLESVAVETVVADGEVVVRDGEPLVGPRAHDYPPAFTDAVDVRVDPEWFRPAAPGGPVRAIRYAGGLLSHETTGEPPTEDGRLRADPAEDWCLATLVDRHPRRDARAFTGFVTGFGIEAGAVATTHTWEVPGLLVVGTGVDPMVRAAARVVELGGGWAVADGGQVTADLPMPLGGYCSTLPVEKTADRLDAVEAAVCGLGADVERPLLGLETLTFPGVPSLKLSFAGYADVLERRLVGLAVE